MSGAERTGAEAQPAERALRAELERLAPGRRGAAPAARARRGRRGARTRAPGGRARPPRRRAGPGGDLALGRGPRPRPAHRGARPARGGDRRRQRRDRRPARLRPHRRAGQAGRDAAGRAGRAAGRRRRARAAHRRTPRAAHGGARGRGGGILRAAARARGRGPGHDGGDAAAAQASDRREHDERVGALEHRVDALVAGAARARPIRWPTRARSPARTERLRAALRGRGAPWPPRPWLPGALRALAASEPGPCCARWALLPVSDLVAGEPLAFAVTVAGQGHLAAGPGARPRASTCAPTRSAWPSCSTAPAARAARGSGRPAPGPPAPGRARRATRSPADLARAGVWLDPVLLTRGVATRAGTHLAAEDGPTVALSLSGPVAAELTVATAAGSRCARRRRATAPTRPWPCRRWPSTAGSRARRWTRPSPSTAAARRWPRRPLRAERAIE